MTYAKPRHFYDVIVTCVSQSVHCMTSCTRTRLLLRSIPYDCTECGVRSRGEGGVEPYDHHQRYQRSEKPFDFHARASHALVECKAR